MKKSINELAPAFSIRLETTQLEKVKELQQKYGMTKNELIRKSVSFFIEEETNMITVQYHKNEFNVLKILAKENENGKNKNMD